MTYKILTANRLTDGLVVYFAECGWQPELEAAQQAYSIEDENALTSQGELAAARSEVADAYLIDISETDDAPLRFRETIRASGPTVRSDLRRPLAKTQNAGT